MTYTDMMVQAPGAATVAPKQTIAVVDDEGSTLKALSASFRGEGFDVRTYLNGMAALEGLTKDPVDLAILDIKMPKMDGIDLLRHLRRQYPTLPIIFLTTRDDEIDQAYGLELGADDYIVKPFSTNLVIERARAVLRRYKSDHLPPADTPSTAVIGKLKYDPERFVCAWNGKNVKLSMSEFLILKALAERPGVIKTREVLTTTAWDADTYVDDRTVDNHVMRIRKSFKKADPTFDTKKDLIQTVYGVGYRLKAD